MAGLCIVLLPSLSRAGIFAPHILLWECFISLALLGYGFAVLRALRLQTQPIAVSACVGVAVWLLLGGWLNLAHLASRSAILLLLTLGFLLSLVELAQKDRRDRISARLHSLSANTPARNTAIPIAIYFLLIFAVHLRPLYWNTYDDQQGYMALADKSANFNTLQSDPFSERRLVTGLGAGIFLNVTMLADADDSAMGYIDAGFGYLVLILSFWSIGRALGLTGWRAVALLYFIPLFTLGKLNLTIVNLSTTLAMAMLLILMRVDWAAGLPPRVALLLGVLLGADCALKSSNIPLCGTLLVFCGIGFTVHSRNWRTLLPFLLPGVTLAAVVLPWMLQLHRDEATFLFPSLGRGYHISAYGLMPLPAHAAPVWQSLLIASPNLLIVMFAGVLSYCLLRDRPPALRIPVLSFACSVMASVLLIAISIAGEGIDRYTAPFYVPCLFLLVASMLQALRSGRQSIYCFLAFAFMSVCGLLFYTALNKRESLYADFDQLLSLTGVQHRMLPWGGVALDVGTMRRNAEVVRSAQQTVPPGQTILEATETAYGYDWRRNTVYIADYPGMAGLPPGPPLFDDAEAMRLYLLHCGIHYVIYDRVLYIPSDSQTLPIPSVAVPTWRRLARALVRHGAPAPWGQQEDYAEQHTRLQFQQIAAHHPVVYDDGRIEVIRLD